MSILDNTDDYQFWRDEKLSNAQSNIEDCLVEIRNPQALSKAEKDKIQQLCCTNNFALFAIKTQDDYAQAVVQINRQVGLLDYDQHLYAQSNGLAYIKQSDKQERSEFIPYTDKAIGWHTDGYYNAVDHRVRAFSLFCVLPAATGGVNQWIDPQMVYLLLREDNADVVKALTHPQAMSIPEHTLDGQVRRAKSTGAVFLIDEPSAELYMRYTQRKKNIEFLDSSEVKQAVTLLDDLLKTPTPHHFEHTMNTNQGLICNNVLHNRSAFVDDPQHPRLLLRGRYSNRVCCYNPKHD
jgi:alpha-ketoglutarate-dependent taurine dioxygenase